MTLEQLAKSIFDECEKDNEPITMEDALEMAQMELGAKSISLGAKSDEKKDKKPRTIKISDEKMQLFSLLWEGLSNYYDNCQIIKENKLISIEINGKIFKIDLIEQRKPKN